MSRILFAFAAIVPGTAQAQSGPHVQGAAGILLRAVSQSDHALALTAAPTLPVAALAWKRRT